MSTGHPPLIICQPPGDNSTKMYDRLRAVETLGFIAQRQSEELLIEQNVGIIYDKGDGSNVWDLDDNRYVDLVAGFGALSFGHAPMHITDAVKWQIEKLSLALGDIYPSALKVQLCERLAEYYPESGARVMLSLSGADAITTALKTSMLATGRSRVIAFSGSYHGLSYGPLAACGFKDTLRLPFLTQLGIPVSFIDFPKNNTELGHVKEMLACCLSEGDVGAVLFEPVQGRGGCHVPPAGFIRMLREECHKTSTLLIADEIWTGFGRTGYDFASFSCGVVPDLICVGKGLGAGWPISACIGRSEIMNSWGKHGGTAIHTGTHFGNPVACAAALAMLDRFEAEKVSMRARDVGSKWKQQLLNAFKDNPSVKIRGSGLMIGIEIEGIPELAIRLKHDLLKRGYILSTAGTRNEVLMLTPALNIGEELLSGFVEAIVLSMKSFSC